jgi:hypothetical protein
MKEELKKQKAELVA